MKKIIHQIKTMLKERRGAAVMVFFVASLPLLIVIVGLFTDVARWQANLTVNGIIAHTCADAAVRQVNYQSMETTGGINIRTTGANYKPTDISTTSQMQSSFFNNSIAVRDGYTAESVAYAVYRYNAAVNKMQDPVYGVRMEAPTVTIYNDTSPTNPRTFTDYFGVTYTMTRPNIVVISNNRTGAWFLSLYMRDVGQNGAALRSGSVAEVTTDMQE